MTTQRPSVLPGPAPRQGRRRSWPVPTALLLLSVIPLLAGSFRVVQLLGGPELIPADDRFAGFPLPLVAHIVGAALFLVIGTFQLVPPFRRRHPAWHRRAGRVVFAAGMVVAGSALWMTLLYSAKPGTGTVLYLLRLVFASAMAICLVLGITTIRRGDVASHRAWMIRAYAIGLAAGTQTITAGVGAALFGAGELQGDLALGSAWFINLAVAEWVIRHPRGSGAARRSQRADPRPERAEASS
jgi:uncharacterized membrane protein